MHFQLTLHHHLYRVHAEKLYLKVDRDRRPQAGLRIKRTIELGLSQKDCVLCKCFVQSLSAASPAPPTPSPSEPNSLCALGSLPQINTLEEDTYTFTIKTHTPAPQQEYNKESSCNKKIVIVLHLI